MCVLTNYRMWTTALRVSVHFVSVHRLWPVAINIVVFIVDNYGVVFFVRLFEHTAQVRVNGQRK